MNAKLGAALAGTVDYLLGRERFRKYDKEAIQRLDEGTRSKLFDIIDTYLGMRRLERLMAVTAF